MLVLCFEAEFLLHDNDAEKRWKHASHDDDNDDDDGQEDEEEEEKDTNQEKKNNNYRTRWGRLLALNNRLRNSWLFLPMSEVGRVEVPT